MIVSDSNQSDEMERGSDLWSPAWSPYQLGYFLQGRSRSGEEVLNSVKERAESPRRQQSGEKQS